jgi:GT2 family glycosyltransferase
MTSEKKKVSVIVPNYNGAHYLEDCLSSLLEQSFKALEIVVVDNASNDHSADLVRKQFPDVRLICLPSNRGFAAAVNKGLESTQGEYILILNNDTRTEPGFVSELYGALEDEPEAAMAAPKILFLRDPRIVNSAGLGYCITGTNHDIGFGRMDGPEFGTPVRIFGPCGGAGMYRRELFRRIGGFDEDFFMYYEDVDLCFRAQLAGFKSMYVPSARVYHAEGGSESTLPRPKEFYFARNALLVIIKDFPARILLKHLPAITWETTKRAGSALLRGEFSAIQACLSAIRMLPKFLAKRREVQQAREAPLREIEALLLKNSSVRGETNIHGRPCKERP